MESDKVVEEKYHGVDGESPERVTNEVGEVLKAEKKIQECVDDETATRLYRANINRKIRRLVGKSLESKKKGKKEECEQFEDLANRFLNDLIKIKRKATSTKATLIGGTLATKIYIGKTFLGTAYNDSDLNAILNHAEKYSWSLIRTDLSNLDAEISFYLSEDVGWKQVWSDPSLTLDKLESKYEVDYEN